MRRNRAWAWPEGRTGSEPRVARQMTRRAGPRRQAYERTWSLLNGRRDSRAWQGGSRCRRGVDVGAGAAGAAERASGLEGTGGTYFRNRRRGRVRRWLEEVG